MEIYDDVVIGSGLAALGVCLGLPVNRSVLVLGGHANGELFRYSGARSSPFFYSGLGGLGNYWHGVIPVGDDVVASVGSQTFKECFEYFYPRGKISYYAGKDSLFVPYRPIRPYQEILRLSRDCRRRINCLPAWVDRIVPGSRCGDVISGDSVYKARRIWVAGGVIGSSGLLARSYGREVLRSSISDHVILYLGLIDGAILGELGRTLSGNYHPVYRGSAANVIYMLRPASFDFRTLDRGIAHRSAFSLPVGGAVGKIVRSFSPGLVAEAVYNRFGFSLPSRVVSVYAQVCVKDAVQFDLDRPDVLINREEDILRASAEARDLHPFDGLSPSLCRNLFMSGIHLHNALDSRVLAEKGLRGSGVFVVDASAFEDIGGEHHSFRVLASACAEAARV